MVADHTKLCRLLKTARGQIDGILKMVDADQYCLDISNQILAAEAILRRVNREIIHAHMENCVRDAIRSGNSEQSDCKIKELCNVLEKIAK